MVPIEPDEDDTDPELPLVSNAEKKHLLETAALLEKHARSLRSLAGPPPSAGVMPEPIDIGQIRRETLDADELRRHALRNTRA